MKWIFLILSLLTMAGVAHTYFFFPGWVRWRARGRVFNQNCYEKSDDLPTVSVIMSVYNEEKVIADKLASLRSADYPRERWHWYIGSDASSDQTNDLIRQIQLQYPSMPLSFTAFQQRRGKPPVLNDLVAQAVQQSGAHPKHILILTDANVLISKQAIFQLVKHFKNTEVALIDAQMLYTGMKPQGISSSEQTYLQSEVGLKHGEGVVWGKMLGPFGGCYALRSDFFSAVPPNYLVDDFYIAMRALEKGGKAGMELAAHCYEGVSHDIEEEYRRKRRISSGNFQNLNTFWHLLTQLDLLSWLFFSHKVLRWITPFLLLLAWFSTGALAWMEVGYFRMIWIIATAAVLLIPIMDILFQKINYNIKIIRGIRYWIWMNIALLEGFFKYVSGIKSNIWQPTRRT